MSHSQAMRVIPLTRMASAHAGSHQGRLQMRSLPPLSLYIHVPWCVRKCPYCDFNSHQAGADLPEEAYLQALQADLEGALPDIWGRQVISVFIGGGTPSLLSAQALDRMLAMVRARLNLLPDAEITMEANPGTVEATRFAAYAASGVNRISLGIQSFNDAHLQALGRVHDSAQAQAAIEIALRSVGRVNLDLMYALPGQNEAQCRADLETALGSGVSHLSLYHLTLEPNTVFAKYPPTLPDEDSAAGMQEMLEARMAQAGFERYEISAYAQPGQQCLHNRNYWEFGDYLGIGPGAHGKLTFHDRIVRQARLKQPQSWIDAALAGQGGHIAETRQPALDELPFEFMLNALRLRRGVPVAWFEERTGIPLADIARMMEEATRKGLLDADPTRLMATPLGWRFLNDLQEIFLA